MSEVFDINRYRIATASLFACQKITRLTVFSSNKPGFPVLNKKRYHIIDMVSLGFLLSNFNLIVQVSNNTEMCIKS